MSEHTPLPWHASRKSRYISDINHKVIAEIAPLHAFEANAELIVRAVNSHEALVSALEDIVKHMERNGMEDWPVAKKARKALALAKAAP